MSANGIMLSMNEKTKFPNKDLVASCKPRNNVIIAGIKPNNVNL